MLAIVAIVGVWLSNRCGCLDFCLVLKGGSGAGRVYQSVSDDARNIDHSHSPGSKQRVTSYMLRLPELFTRFF